MFNNKKQQHQKVKLIDVKKIKEDIDKIINSIKEDLKNNQTNNCSKCVLKAFCFLPQKSIPSNDKKTVLRNLLLVKECPPRICKPKPLSPKVDLNQLFKQKHK